MFCSRTLLQTVYFAIGCALGVGCARIPAPQIPVVPAPSAWIIEGEATFSAQVIEGEPLPEEGLSSLSGTSALRMRVNAATTANYADGSEGWTVRFGEVAMGSGPDRLEPATALEGRGVEIRRFPEGELLSLQPLSGVVGVGRQLDAWDLVFPLLSPHPEGLEGAKGGLRMVHWTLRLVPGRQQRTACHTEWRLSPREGDGWWAEYAGPCEVIGRDHLAAAQLRSTGTGRLSGRLELDPTGTMVSHEMTLERTVKMPFDGSNEGVAPRILAQNQMVRLRLARDPAGPSLGVVPIRIEPESSWVAAIRDQLNLFAACPRQAGQAQELELVVDGSGKVLESKGETCFAEAARLLHMPGDDLGATLLRFSLGVGGDLGLSPPIAVERRARGHAPLFLFLDGGDVAEKIALLLGYSLSPRRPSPGGGAVE